MAGDTKGNDTKSNKTRDRGSRPPRRRLLDDPNAPLVPRELEKWETRGGLLGGPIAIAVVIFFLFTTHPALHIWLPAPIKHHPHRIALVSLVPEFWVSVAMAVAMVVTTYFNKRQLLAIVTILEGLSLMSFGIEFAFPFVVFGIWIMLRASRRTRQLAARGEGPAARRSRSASGSGPGKGTAPTPAASKRYTPPKKKKGRTDEVPSLSTSRGGMIKDLPRKAQNESEPEGLMKLFAGKQKPGEGQEEQ